MVKINIDIQKKDLWLISVIFVFLIGGGFVIAFGDYSGNEAGVNGHTSDEMMVDVPDYGTMTLQNAISNKLLGNNSGTGLSFGEWEVKSDDTIYHATSDGLVVVEKPNDGGSGDIIGLTDGDSDPSTVRVRAGWSDFARGAGFTMPVKKDDYWKTQNALNIYWIPIVSGGSSGGSPNNCEWVTVGINEDVICPSGKIVAGVSRDSRDTHRELDGVYCCNFS